MVFRRNGAVIGGARADTLTINNEMLDATDKQSGGWRELIADAAVRTVSAECSGILKGSAFPGFGVGVNFITGCTVEFTSVAAYGVVSGDFMLTNVNISGAQNGAVEFSGTFEMTGEIGWTKPHTTVAPLLTGVATVGEILTTTNGTWSGSATIVLARQWQRSADGSTWGDIAAATGTTYTLQAADEAQFIRVQVTATNSVDATLAYSNILGPVAP